ncbi:carbon-nitrogen hydrolase family protein [Marinactinospora thermotolerans]|uniref:Predicted amidohydrolase n=1 Tax=Marinactinospora thermotolerans DSM 45154 TaxID=1122192 RepID=A0A1T4NPA2_9ACTN|nr:carbon-nitrogen hydrolase family protein [Marinactinospora thermotolerans]SJZ80876.1 Predicted amidohydrolase [Marinactinospora thermotolerans DSM 45154]
MRIALCQTSSTDDPAANLESVRAGVAEAAARGAGLVVFPEAAMVRFGVPLAPLAQPLDGPWAEGLRAIAAEAGVTVVAGMFTPASEGRVSNVLLATGGGVEAAYRKIHVYDAFGHRESDSVEPGAQPVVIEVDGVRIGLATCYDVRFPELFRHLARHGAVATVLCASWGTGEGKLDQWRLLTRARALDSTSWILACDQADPETVGETVTGNAPRGIGHSAVIDPTGRVVHELGAAPETLVVDIDPATVTGVREAIPVLANARL